jgi:pseudaminic acid cytidylyltransferase
LKALAIIPARGGSKRLPRKNITNFLGKPIIVYTIEAALESGMFEQVLVSTEDQEIADVAGRFGARVVARPKALATDYVQVKDVCLQVLDEQGCEGWNYEVFACLYATSPLRSAADISATLALVQPGVFDFAMAVTNFPYPPHQALRLEGEQLVPMWPDLVNKRSQEIGALFIDNGSTYCASVAAFREYKSFYGPGLRGHLMPFDRSVDIDVEADLDLARLSAARYWK